LDFGLDLVGLLAWNVSHVSKSKGNWKIWLSFWFNTDRLNNNKFGKIGFFFFCRFICCLCLMKQNSDDLHASTMDSVILMKGFEFICPLSKRLFGYFVLLNISFLLKWKIGLDYIFEKLMKISSLDCFQFSVGLF
jgi:hypothetical protein